MYYFDLMYDFVEGKLDSHREDELFTALHSDDALRARMKNLYAIKTAANNAAPTYKPSPKSTMAVFSALNIAPPESIVAEPVSNFRTKFTAAMKNYRQGIIGGMIVTVLLLSSFFIFYEPADTKIAANNTNIKASGIPVVSSTENTGDVQSTDNTIRQNQTLATENNIDEQPAAGSSNTVKTKKSHSNRTNYFNIGMEENKGTNISGTEALAESPKTENESFVKFYGDLSRTEITNTNFDIIPLSVKKQENFNNGLSNLAPVFLTLEDELGLDLSAEIKTSGTVYTKTPQIANTNSVDLGNFAITGFIKLNDNLKAGLEFRQESFYHELSAPGLSGNNYQLLNHENYITAGAVLRYNFIKLEDSGFSPFAQGAIGTTSKGGYLGRMMLGTEYHLFDNFSAVGGLEYSILNKEIQGLQSGNGSKFNIHVGILWDFK